MLLSSPFVFESGWLERERYCLSEGKRKGRMGCVRCWGDGLVLVVVVVVGEEALYLILRVLGLGTVVWWE